MGAVYKFSEASFLSPRRSPPLQLVSLIPTQPPTLSVSASLESTAERENLRVLPSYNGLH